MHDFPIRQATSKTCLGHHITLAKRGVPESKGSECAPRQVNVLAERRRLRVWKGLASGGFGFHCSEVAVFRVHPQPQEKFLVIPRVLGGLVRLSRRL